MLGKARKWLGADYACQWPDVSNAALGELWRAGSSYLLLLEDPFAIASEFGQVISGHDST